MAQPVAVRPVPPLVRGSSAERTLPGTGGAAVRTITKFPGGTGCVSGLGRSSRWSTVAPRLRRSGGGCDGEENLRSDRYRGDPGPLARRPVEERDRGESGLTVSELATKIALYEASTAPTDDEMRRRLLRAATISGAAAAAVTPLIPLTAPATFVMGVAVMAAARRRQTQTTQQRLIICVSKSWPRSARCPRTS